MKVNGAGATYSFTASKNRTLEAKFTYAGGGGGGGNNSPKSATLSAAEAEFDKSDQKDVSVTLSSGSYSFRGIRTEIILLSVMRIIL